MAMAKPAPAAAQRKTSSLLVAGAFTVCANAEDVNKVTRVAETRASLLLVDISLWLLLKGRVKLAASARAPV
jgi:hypothetical protein